MTKFEFLDAIKSGISALSDEDKNRTLNYYSEMIDDRIEDGISEEEAVAAMGEPDRIIAEILNESTPVEESAEAIENEPSESAEPASNGENNKNKKRKYKKVLLICGVLTMFLWIFATVLFMPIIKAGFDREALLSDKGLFHVDDDTSAISAFESISIKEGISDVVIVPTDNEKCYVEFTKIEGIQRFYEIGNDGTLYLTYIDDRSWFQKIGSVWFLDSKITIYLPHNKYASLNISASSSDVYVADEFEFGNAEIKTSSGDIDFNAEIDDSVAKLESSSGDINVSNITKGGFVIETASGDINIENVYLCEKIEIDESNMAEDLNTIYDRFGQIRPLSLKTSSGDITVKGTRSTDFLIETSSGDVTLENVYNYVVLQVECASGDINADNTISLCSVSFETSSGDIEFDGLDSYSGISLRSSSGDIDGYISSNCYFSCVTSSGSVDIPQNNGDAYQNGRPLHQCSVTTSSGDISIRTPQ